METPISEVNWIFEKKMMKNEIFEYKLGESRH